MKTLRLLLLSLLLPLGTCHAAIAAFGELQRVEFSPTGGESLAIPFVLTKQAQVRITITGPDRHPVRTLASSGVLKPGRHQLVWDGRDAKGKVVPDEAWVPVLETVAGNRKERIDPWEASGGEVVEKVEAQIDQDGTIAYRLPVPARVLIRTGVDGGPMLKTLANWTPRPAGRNLQRWDGYDADRLFDLRRAQGFSLLVTAFALPHPAIITRGNDAIDYVGWSRANNLEPFHLAPDARRLERKGRALSPHHYLSRTMDRDPVVHLAFGGTAAVKEVLVIEGVTPIQVDVPPEDRWLLDASLYEVAFFVDHQFVSEEEQGYLPLTWLWDPAGLEPGRHLLTVNVSGFRGQVGVKSIEFEIPARR